MNQLISYLNQFYSFHYLKNMEKQLYLTQPTEGFYQQHFRGCKISKKGTLLTTKSIPKNKNKRSNKYWKMNDFNSQNYYVNKSIKPGFHTLKTILNIQYQREYDNNINFPYLTIKLPLCISLVQNQFCIFHTEKQKLATVLEINYFNYKEKLDKHISFQQNKPLFIQCTSDGNLLSKKIVMTEDFSFSSFPKTQSSFLMQYIMPYSMQPNLLRLFFVPKGNKIFKKSYAYKMVNKIPLSEEIFAKKSKLHHYFFVQQDKQETYNVSIIKGKSLIQFEEMSQRLVEYLQRTQQIIINQIVIDFVIDSHKQPWIFEIKDISLTQNTSIWLSSNPQQVQLLTKKLRQYIECPLCKCNYVKNQMQHIVTQKLIFEFLTHLQLRGKSFLREIDSNIFRKHNQNLKVCKLCYEVIVAEHQLINTEKIFCKFLNFKLDQIICQVDNQSKKFKQDNFYQWRMMVYIERCKETPIKYNFLPQKSELHMFCREKKDILKCPFKDQNQDKSYKSHLLRQTKHYKANYLSKSISRGKQSQKRTKYTSMNTSQTIFQNNFQQYCEKQNIEIDAIKMYTFYSKGQSISKFLQNTKIDFSLHFNNNKFEGTCSSLQGLYNKPSCQRTSSQIFLFDEKLKHCSLQVTVGLICDGKVSSQLAYADQEQFVDDIIFCPKGIKICEALPREWIECFFDGEAPHQSQDQIDKIFDSAMNIMGIIASRE